MPPAYTPTQKGAIAQFVSFTSTKDSVAARVSRSWVAVVGGLIWENRGTETMLLIKLTWTSS